MATWCRMRRAELQVVDRFFPRWAWVLQDILGIAFCLYMLKTIRLPTFKVRLPGSMAGSPRWRSEDWVQRHGSRVLGSEHRSPPPPLGTGPGTGYECSPGLLQACTLLLLVLFIYDVFFVFITPFLTKVGPLCPPSCPPQPHPG